MKGLQLLQEAGFVVHTTHFRYYKGKKKPRPRTSIERDEWGDFVEEPLTNGGVTKVLVLSPSGHWARGEAKCNREDVFQKWEGTAMALQQALNKFTGVVPNGYQLRIDAAVNAMINEAFTRDEDRNERLLDVERHHEEDGRKYAQAREDAAERKALKEAGKPIPGRLLLLPR